MLDTRIDTIIRTPLLAEGFDVVCVRVTGQKRLTVQVFLERTGGESISLDDCARMTPVIGTLLDVADPFSGAWTLEVSSPGIERPLWRREDYTRFVGRSIRFQTTVPLEGQKRFQGVLESAGEEGIRVCLAGTGEAQVTDVPWGSLRSAHLVPDHSSFSSPRRLQKGTR
jgi:ribosome maturation factor RimP